MIKKPALLFAGIASFALAAPSLADTNAQHIDTLLDEADTAAAEPGTPTMSFGTWGVDPALLSDSVAPGDDFFAYVNQPWLDANPLPAEFSRFGAFNLLREKSTNDVKALIDELAAKNASSLSNDERRIIDTYNAFLDTDAIEANGLAPIQPYVTRIVRANTLNDLALLWAEPGFASPWAVS